MRILRRHRVLFPVVLLTAIGAGILGVATPFQHASAQGELPNIVVILVDDLDLRSYDVALHQLLPGGGTIMPNLLSLTGDGHTTNFDNSFVSYPLCCPSRATLLTGQYAHNHGVLGNGDQQGQIGGCTAFEAHEGATLAAWLHNPAAQYRAGIFGKYLNGYGNDPSAPSTSCLSPLYVPPTGGWDYWEVLAGWRRAGAPGQGLLKWGNPQSERDYMANIQGSVGQSLLTPTVYTEYQTNKLATDAVAFMNTTPVQPFFAYVAPTAPHRESGHVDTDGVYTCRDNIETTPTIRADDGDGALANMFEPPQELLYSFDEADVLDKPSWVQSLPRYGPTQAEHDAEVNCTKEVYRSRLESLRAVDDLVAAIKTAGDNAPNGRKTVIFLTSDNGFYLGQHRAQQKELGYEEGIGVPLMVYDPNTPNSCGNRTLSNVVVNTDLAPTILDLAGVPLPAPPYDVDGQSLKQLVEPLDVITCTTPPITRYRFLIEHFEHASQAPYPTFFGMRMRGPPEAMYLEGLPIAPPAEGEYYNLVTDQWQLTSSYPDCGGGPGSCSSYSSTLQSLKDCGKPGYSTCQSLETQP